MSKVKTLYHSDDELVDMIRETLECETFDRGVLILILEILTEQMMEDGLAEGDE